MKRLVYGVAVLLAVQRALFAAGADEVKAAIARGSNFLQTRVGNLQGSRRTLTVLAIYKAGGAKDSPLMKDTLEEIRGRCQGEAYVPGSDSIYQAGVEATLLADVDPEAYTRELTLLRDYIIKQQLANGGWDYPQGHGPGCNGDTSVTQYACLGLWAAARAGLEIDPSVWTRVIDWHMQYQNSDGGYAYCPKFGPDQNSSLNMSIAGIGSMHVAMLHIDPNLLPLSSAKPAAEKETSAKETPKFGVLEKLAIDGGVQKRASATVPAGSVAAVKKAFGWLEPRFRVDNKASPFSSYYYYTLERMAALANVKTIGGHDWFDDCADYLLKNQKPDGSWKESPSFDELLDTDFCVLFLTRSTGKLLKRVKQEEFGEGTLAGGRGLPDDLSEARFNGRQLMAKDAPVQPLDLLLASLQNTGDIDLDQVQEQIVEQIQLGDRQELVGQADRLLQLVHNPSAEVRRVAIWAIGRSDRMDLGVELIRALDDPDLGVIIEARNALCWLSRKPAGFGNAEDPLSSLPPDATEQQKKDAVASWHRSLVLAWGEWYLQNRPFDQRGDEFEARLRRRMQQLKLGAVELPMAPVKP